MGLKTQNDRFPSKIALFWKKICYKVSLCENRQRQSCKAFIGLSIRAKMICEDDPFYAKICPPSKTPILIFFRSYRLIRDT